MRIERALYNMARKDLLASEVLYKNKKYPQSMFLFQQGVEKANKVLGLLEGIIRPDELLNIGHDSMKLYKKSILYRKAKMDEIMTIANQFPNMKKHHYYKQVSDHAEDIKRSEKFLRDLQKDNLLRLKRDTLYYCLDQMWDVYYAELDFFEKINLEEIIEYQYSLNATVNPEAAEKEKARWKIALHDPKNVKEFTDSMKLSFERIVDMAFVNCTFYYSAVVTLPHAMKARYPEPDMSFNPLTFYTRKLPLVDLQPEFIWCIKKALLMLPSFNYNELKKA